MPDEADPPGPQDVELPLLVRSVRDYALFTLDPQGRVTSWNAGAQLLKGWRREEIIGRHFSVFYPQEDQDAGKPARELLLALERGSVEDEGLRVRKDGSRFWADVVITAVRDAAGALVGFTKLTRDLSDRRRTEDELREARRGLEQRVHERTAELTGAIRELRVEISRREEAARSLRLSEAALRASEQQYRRIVEASADAILTADAAGSITSWNRAASLLFGYAPGDAIGSDVARLIPPERGAELDEVLRRLAAGEERVELETLRLRKDGVPVEVRASVSLLRGARGDVERLITMRDLTAERAAAAALRRTEEQLRQAQKMDAIGRLAGGVAHDFNNILSVILSDSALLLADLRPEDPIRGEVEEIRQSALRAAELTRQLLVFSRQQVVEPKVVDLNALVGGLERMLPRLLGEDIEFTFVRGPSLGWVHIDPGSLEQVVINLVVNARDAMPDGGRLTLETANVALDEEYARQHLGARAGLHVMLAVSDTGVGMDPEVQARVFEPFFTTKGTGKGTGLGLSIVHGIVQQAGGSVWLYSEKGKGAVFKIYLPQTEADPERAQPPAEQAAQAVARTVLLVEDDARVRGVGQRILERAGYRVLACQGAAEAVQACEAHAGEIHLLLTDVVMPQTDGPGLARRLRGMRPEMKVLFMSGYTDDAVVRHGLLAGELAFLQKPFTPDSLLRKVAEVLAGTP